MNKSALLLLLFIIASPSFVFAEDVVFTENAVIGPGDIYDNVTIYNPSSLPLLVEITGGTINGILTIYGEPVVNITGGDIAFANIGGLSEVNMSGGRINDYLDLGGYGVFNMNGGYVWELVNHDETFTVNLRGGSVGQLGAWGSVNIYGYGLYATDIGEMYDFGWVGGEMQYGFVFHTPLWNFEAYENLILHDLAYLQAQLPSPLDGEVGVDIDTSLSWEPAPGGIMHQVYLSDSYGAVKNADSNSSQYYIGLFDKLWCNLPYPLEQDTTYWWRVDEIHNLFYTQKGNVWHFKTAVYDTTDPCKPTGFGSFGKTDTSIPLYWDPSSDNIGVEGYKIWRDGQVVGTSPTENYTNRGLSPSTEYVYEVCAFDAAGNESQKSIPLSITTDRKLGKLRFYIEKNGTAGYQPDDLPAANADVYYNSRLQASRITDANGIIVIREWEKANDEIFVRSSQPVYSRDAVKGPESSPMIETRELPMFNLYMDNDWLDDNGILRTYTVSFPDMAEVSQGQIVNIQLKHPVFCWNLVVALGFDADEGYLSQLEEGFELASDYMFDVTDGHAKLGTVIIYDNVSESSDVWLKTADIRIYEDLKEEPYNETNSDLSIIQAVLQKRYRIIFPDYFNHFGNYNDGDALDNKPNSNDFYRTIVHELGHYFFGFSDEYRTGNYEKKIDSYREINPEEIPSNYGFMDKQFSSTEMSSYNDYLQDYASKTWEQITNQIWRYYRSSGGEHIPCWQHFYNLFDSNAPNPVGGAEPLCQEKWENYNGIEVCIAKPKDAIEPFAHYGQSDAPKDRHKETITPVSYRKPDITIVPYQPEGSGQNLSMQMFDQSNQVTEESSSNGSGLLVSAEISAPNTIRVMVFTDTDLIEPPVITVSPWYDNPVLANVTQINSKSYEGQATIGQATEGRISVVVTFADGYNELTERFKVLDLVPDNFAILRSPGISFYSSIPEESLQEQTMAVVMDCGNGPILPLQSSLILVAKPTSFNIQDNVSVENVCNLTWELNLNDFKGLDSNLLMAMRFDEASCQWNQVEMSYDPISWEVSVSDVGDGIFALFAEESNDIIPPSPITDLVAVTGQTDWSVVLSWTASGDDNNSGKATNYQIYFDNSEIKDPNGSGCLPLYVYASPKTAGQTEEYTFEMPDPDTHYYFAVMTLDDAGNRSEISNIADAVSNVRDTDGDGLSDQWEMTYGFDPNNTGEELLDSDEDGLINIYEYKIGTIPTVPDSDGDGLSDEAEVIDFNGNGTIDFKDFAILASQWRQVGSGLSADVWPVEGDGTVDMNELSILLMHWVEQRKAGLSFDLNLSKTWMYQNIPDSLNSQILATVIVTEDPMDNSSYSYEWEFVLASDINIEPVTVGGGQANDPNWIFAAVSCNWPSGLSDLGQNCKIRVTVTGEPHGNAWVKEIDFGTVLLGDINNDGSVDAIDENIVSEFIQNGTVDGFTLIDCDINSDGFVTEADRDTIVSIIYGTLGQNSVSTPSQMR